MRSELIIHYLLFFPPTFAMAVTFLYVQFPIKHLLFVKPQEYNYIIQEKLVV